MSTVSAAEVFTRVEPERLRPRCCGEIRGGAGRCVPESNGKEHQRRYVSIFGEFVLSRVAYGSREGQKIEFVPLDAQRVLAILVFADQEVQNRIIQTRRPFEAGELERVGNYLNAHFAGRPVAEIRATLLRELRNAQSEMQALLAQSVELAEQALAPDGDDMVLAGQTRLMGVQELADLDRLRELFEAFARKREILQLLERTVSAPGLRIFIGEETGLAPLEGVSLVTAPYTSGGRVLGVLGVIGPTRMAYDRVIPVVQAAADALGDAFQAGEGE